MMKRLLVILFILCLFPVSVFAHPGRTDANGGHRDSSTGEYHYHHGYPEHQHINGECPYDRDYNKASYTSNSKNNSANTVDASKYNNVLTDLKQTTRDYNRLVTMFNGLLITIVCFLVGVLIYYRHKILPLKEYKVDTAVKLGNLNKTIEANKQLETNIRYIQTKLDSYKNQEAELKKKIIELNNAKNEISVLEKQIIQYREHPRAIPKLTYKDIIAISHVPFGVSFDEYLLPHYYKNETVEKNMHVYIANTGNHYHRKYGCCGAKTPTHLFIAASNFKPCKICITSQQGQNYQIPPWYYHFLDLSAPHEQKDNNQVRYQLKNVDESIESLKE